MKKFIIMIFSLLFMVTNAFAKDINVAFTIDNNYPVFTLLAINSILNNNDSNSHYNFYIVENNMTEKNKKWMKKYVQERNQNIEFINFNTNVIDDGDHLFGFVNRITRIGMARIMLPEILPKSVHKVIYLDGDILVTEDLKNLYDINLGKYPVGMAQNMSDFITLDAVKLKDGYFNSGVILMNLDVWRKNKISKQMVSFVKNNKEKFIYREDDEEIYSKLLLYPDQDLINIVLNGKIKEIPQRWNNQTIRGHILAPLDGGGIVHYIGSIKPWTYHFNPGEPYRMYHRSWNTSGLVKYKFYYGTLSIRNAYLDLYLYKIKRIYRFKAWVKNLFENKKEK